MEQDDLAVGTEFTTPTKYAPAVKARAYELYLNTDLDTTDIAIDVGVPRSTVSAWAREGHWLDRKREIEQELMQRSEDSYRQLIIRNRKPVLERHLRISEKLEKAIEKVIDEATRDDGVPSDIKLKRLAEALSSATGISARAAALSDKPFGDVRALDDRDKQAKVPLIMIGIQPQASPDNAPPITVTADDAEQ